MKKMVVDLQNVLQVPYAFLYRDFYLTLLNILMKSYIQ